MSDVLRQKEVLKLNKLWEPIQLETPKVVFGDLSKHKVTRKGQLIYDDQGNPARVLKAVAIEWPLDANGDRMLNEEPSYEVVDWDVWVELPVRSFDLFVNTAKRKIRIPRVVMTCGYGGMPVKRPDRSLNTVYNLYHGICCYSKKKIPRSRATKDHYIPLSKGGSNELENIRLADIEWNQRKGDQMPADFGFPNLPAVLPKTQRMAELLTNHRNIPEWELFIHAK
ncbi:MAG: HNH endonuclease [Nitrosomonadaceae bacterium]|nr:HNH endonuclease [Nitrosomonadaceae bacterium]